ncbi:MAG: hypothetical protein MRZ45_10560 [Blautia sp.]|nr:hypothetical protein [Blautia sp.]
MDGKTRKEMMKEEKDKLKGMPFKKKLAYVWEYYKGVIGIAVFVIVIICLCAQMMKGSGRTTELSVAMINAQKTEGTEVLKMEKEFIGYLGLDEGKQTLAFDDSYLMNLESGDPMTVASQTKLLASIQAETLDVILMPEDIYENYMVSGAFADLEEKLGEEFLEVYRDMICEGRSENDTQDKGYALRIADNVKLKGIYGDQTVYLSATVNAGNVENIKKFVQYLLS